MPTKRRTVLITHRGAPGGSTRARRRHPVWKSMVVACAALVIAPGAYVSTASADTPGTEDPAVISTWNALALTTLAADPTKKAPEMVLYVGFVQAAVYDAVVGVDGRYAPYRFHARARRGTSATAAAVSAAHEVLITYSPYAKATLDTAYTASLAQIPDGTPKSRGVAFGLRAAEHLIRLRSNDGRNAPVLFNQPPATGVWRPTPPTFTTMLDPWLGDVTPLLVHSADQFAPPPPPTLTSAAYTRDFNEVKAFGSLSSTVRTQSQTDTARFFSGSTVVQYNASLRNQMASRHMDIADAARMFAAVDMASADALITVWRAKYRYGFWRPITAINLADTDGNAATTSDPTWVPFAATPAYPEYPSGYNVLTAAFTGGLAELFRTDKLDINLISTAVPNVNRYYGTGTALRSDVVNARVWLGFHFRTADLVSRDLGLRLTDWALDHNFGSPACR